MQPNFPNPLGGPNELLFQYPPNLGLPYGSNGTIRNYTTPGNHNNTVFGENGVIYGSVAIRAARTITSEKYPNLTLFDGPFQFDFGPGRLRFYIQMTIVSYPTSGYNSTFVGVNYNVTYTDANDNPTGNSSVIAAELQRANYTIDLTGPIYLPTPRTLTNRTCQSWVPYNCKYTRFGTGQTGGACGSQINIPVTRALSFNYLFPAGYMGFGNNGTLQNMLRPVWGIGISRDAVPGTQSSTYSCNQFRQARADDSGRLVVSAATKRHGPSFEMISLTLMIMMMYASCTWQF